MYTIIKINAHTCRKSDSNNGSCMKQIWRWNAEHCMLVGLLFVAWHLQHEGEHYHQSTSLARFFANVSFIQKKWSHNFLRFQQFVIKKLLILPNSDNLFPWRFHSAWDFESSSGSTHSFPHFQQNLFFVTNIYLI